MTANQDRLREAQQVIADDILRRIALRYKNCEVHIYPDLPELTPVEAVLRCAHEEGFVLTNRLAAVPEVAGGAARYNLLSSIPLATEHHGLRDGWTIDPDFLLEVKSHLPNDAAIDLEEIETMVLTLNQLQTKYHLGQPAVQRADAPRTMKDANGKWLEHPKCNCSCHSDVPMGSQECERNGCGICWRLFQQDWRADAPPKNVRYCGHEVEVGKVCPECYPNERADAPVPALPDFVDEDDTEG